MFSHDNHAPAGCLTLPSLRGEPGVQGQGEQGPVHQEDQGEDLPGPERGRLLDLPQATGKMMMIMMMMMMMMMMMTMMRKMMMIT